MRTQPENLNSIPALSTDQMIEVDRLMIEEFGILLIQMMENAGRNLADLAIQMMGEDPRTHTVAVLCGSGNNGGGGMVAARHLHNRGVNVTAVLTSDSPLKDIPAHQWKIIKQLGLTGPDNAIELVEFDLILDAMIGYGLIGNPRNLAKKWIEAANFSKKPILALDTPSGLDTSSGIPGDPCIRAEATLTLALPKSGLLAQSARDYVGSLYLADISVPGEVYKRIGLDVGPIFSNESIIKIS